MSTLPGIKHPPVVTLDLIGDLVALVISICISVCDGAFRCLWAKRRGSVLHFKAVGGVWFGKRIGM